MWPFKKKPTPPPKPVVRYGTTNLQVGDECVCVRGDEHTVTHQKLLQKGGVYKVTEVTCDHEPAAGGYGGPWVRVLECDLVWSADRFRKVVKPSILTQVMEPVDLDVKRVKEEAYL